MHTYICVHAQVRAHVPHHPSLYPSQLSFWDRAKLEYGGVVIPGAYARGRMPLPVPCADTELGREQTKPLGKDAVVMLRP